MPVRHNKLVRDRIPEIIQAQGQHPVTRILDNASYQEALLAKLAEETRETQEPAAEDLPDELADIVEVIQALATAVGMSWVQLLALAADKRTAAAASRADLPRNREAGGRTVGEPRQTERSGGASHSRQKAPYRQDQWLRIGDPG